jgi:hypothetical protein
MLEALTVRLPVSGHPERCVCAAVHVAMLAMHGEGSTNLTGWFAPFRYDLRSARVYGCMSWPAAAGFSLPPGRLPG